MQASTHNHQHHNEILKSPKDRSSIENKMLFINMKEIGFVSLFIVLLKLRSKRAIKKDTRSGITGIRMAESIRFGISINCLSPMTLTRL